MTYVATNQSRLEYSWDTQEYLNTLNKDNSSLDEVSASEDGNKDVEWTSGVEMDSMRECRKDRKTHNEEFCTGGGKWCYSLRRKVEEKMGGLLICLKWKWVVVEG
jgi:hypothetical protein